MLLKVFLSLIERYVSDISIFQNWLILCDCLQYLHLRIFKVTLFLQNAVVSVLVLEDEAG